jgi:Leucine-rich repeat (LRR) protein
LAIRRCSDIGSFPFLCVQELNLHGNGIRRINGLAELRSLQSLILSFNSIETLEGLNSLSKLTLLDVSFNRIRSVLVPIALSLVSRQCFPARFHTIVTS